MGRILGLRTAALFAPAPTEAKVVAPSEVKGAGVQFLNPALFQLFGSFGSSETETLEGRRAMAASVICYACISYRQQKLVEAPLMVVEEGEDGETWLQSHPLNPLLDEPNPDQDMTDLLEETQGYLDIEGRALWAKSLDRAGRVGELRAFSGDEFQVERGIDGQGRARLFGTFRLSTSDGTVIRAPEEVVLFKFFDPNDRLGGLSPTDAVLAHLQIGHELRKRVKAALKNAALPGGIYSLHPDVKLSDQEYERVVARLNTQFQGAKTGKTILAEGGGAFSRVAMSLEELQMGPVWREVEAAACMAYRVRPEIIGAMVGLENAPWSHMDTARRLSYEDGIAPLWNRYERTLKRQLLRPVDSNPKHLIRFDTSRIKALQDDREQKSRTAKLNADIWTRDERRIYTGQEPIGGERGEEFVAAARPTIAGIVPPTEPPTKRAERKGEDADRAERWLAFDKLTRSQEPGWKQVAQAQLDADRDAILGLAKSTLRTAQKDDFGPADPASVQDLIRDLARTLDAARAPSWRQAVTPLVEASGKAAVKQIATELGISFDLLQPGLLGYTKAEAAWLVTKVTDSTKQGIRDALAAGLEAGESIPNLTKRIQEATEFSPERAQLIAQSETTRVFNGAQRDSLAAYAASENETLTKEWLTARDSHVRDAHRELEGKTVGIDDTFPNGLQAPGEPNCRCTLLYHLGDDE